MDKDTLAGKEYYKQIDAYSLMEYLSWTMDEEKFKEKIKLVEVFKSNNVYYSSLNPSCYLENYAKD